MKVHSDQWVDEMTEGLQLPRDLTDPIQRMIAAIEGEETTHPERAKVRTYARTTYSDYGQAFSELRDALIASEDDSSLPVTGRVRAATRHMGEVGGELVFALRQLCNIDPELPQALPEQTGDALAKAEKRFFNIYVEALRLQRMPDELTFKITDAIAVPFKEGDVETGLIAARYDLANAFREFYAAARKSQLCEKPAALQPIHERSLQRGREHLCRAVTDLAKADPSYAELRDEVLSALQIQRARAS